ncbi:IS1182 family transposase [uncultured Methanobrevibacter sp.]|uniref:IS1182 family transposase n=1 Tax=uncultured Methanobrevibacter sp. TaxID=253161 RepID=UPI0026DEA611|nr:IS1182 family transposase [uncultured Methanobrevibacter sp.]
MVLKDDTINQTMLVPMDLRNLIPEDHPCYFIKNVVDYIDCSDANSAFVGRSGEAAYPRELLLRLILMSVFDGGLSSREIERRTRTDVGYMYLAGMQKPSFKTIARFKADYPDLIDEAFKTTIKIGIEEGLVKIHHLSLDGTKIKAKASINQLTNKQQLELMKQHLQESNELDEQEDEELGEESGNAVPETLTDEEKFQEVVEKINKSSDEGRNKDKLRSSSKKLLKQANENPEKIMKKLEILSEKLEESGKDVISINDPDSRFMKNKKGNWEYDYNGQIAVDEYKGIILASYITNNPTDHYELIPLMEQVQQNLTQTNTEFSPNFQVSADNGYSTDINTEYLEQKGLDGYISSRKLSRQNKKYNLTQKPFSKDNFAYNHEMNTYQCPLGQPLYKQKEYEYKNKKRITYWTKECKNCPVQEYCAKNQRYRTIEDYGNPSKIRMQRKMETKEAQKIYKLRSKTAELPFANMKQNMHLTEFKTTGLKQVNTEFKLYTIGHNLKRIYNEIKRKNT